LILKKGDMKKGIFSVLAAVSLILIAILSVKAAGNSVTIVFSCDTYGEILPCV
jgi:hypothetical protein